MGLRDPLEGWLLGLGRHLTLLPESHNETQESWWELFKVLVPDKGKERHKFRTELDWRRVLRVSGGGETQCGDPGGRVSEGRGGTRKKP